MLLAIGTPSEAGCRGVRSSLPLLDPPATLAGTYDPTGAGSTQLPGTISIQTLSGSNQCHLNVVIASTDGGYLSGPGGQLLRYALDGNFALAKGFSSSLLNVAIPSPMTYAVIGRIIIPPGQIANAGIYSTTYAIRLYEGGSLLVQGTMTMTVNVISSCTLPPPDVAALDFSAGINQGRISGGYRQATAIQGASCTGPAMLTVKGVPMVTNSSATPAFANSIDYQATARLGSSQATLSTANANQVSVSTPAGAGDMSIDVMLLSSSKPLMAGSYSSMLSIVLAPAN